MEILIVGCGIAGPAFASFLLLDATEAQRKTLKITILERAAELRPYGQNVDIRGYGVEMLRKLSLEAVVRAAVTGEEGVQLVDAYHRIWSSHAADKTGKIQTPTSDIEILRGRLAQLLWKRNEQISEENKAKGGHGINYMFGDYISELEQDDGGVSVTFAKSGEKKVYDIVVGADGAQSRTRALAWGAGLEETAVHSLGVYGAFFSMPSEAHDTKWRKWFHTTRGRAIMLRPDDSGERCTLFMTVMNSTDERLGALGKKLGSMDEKKALMRECFEGTGWETERILREMDSAGDFYYDALVQIQMDRWSKGRVVLLGDAGYCASPMSGMGTTLALTGACSLANAILRHDDNLVAAFDEYETDMRPIATKSQKLAPGMPRCMHPQALWELVLFHGLIFVLNKSGIFWFLAKMFGPPADKVSLEEH